MEISQERFELALKQLSTGDWEIFEKLSSTFLASEWPNLRTIASASGDGGRDSELFSPNGNSGVSIQYSVQVDWAGKIRKTIKRLGETFPDVQILVYMSNQKIGAKADSLRKEFQDKGIFLDIRDLSWFVERANLDANRAAAATDLARLKVDPMLESKGILARSASALSGQEAKTALVFLEMQWGNEASEKGLTKSAFEALVRGALHGTSNDARMTRSQIHARVCEFLPKHPPQQLIPFVDASLRRLTKSAVRAWPGDEFTLSHEEIERLKNEAASIKLLNDAFEGDVREIIIALGIVVSEKQIAVINLVHKIIEGYFLRRGEEFAAALSRDLEVPINDGDLMSLIIENSPPEKIVAQRSNVTLLEHIVNTLLASPSDSTKHYLRLLSDCYTLFAFLEEVPDVQRVTKKLFNHGEIWLDTSVLLPVFAEQAFPESLRPFTAMFEQARAAHTDLFVTAGILEEIERHLNLCVAYTRSESWDGRVPYVYSRYAIAGRSRDAFGHWIEQFRGAHQPVEDIAEYLSESFGIEVLEPSSKADLDTDIASAISEYWQGIHDRRRNADGAFNMGAHRLAEHDIENILSVLTSRKSQQGKSPLGYSSWLLTLDSAARRMLSKLDDDVARRIKHSPVMSIDFLLKYLAFGPSRDRVDHTGQGLPHAFSDSILESLPKDLIIVAEKVRLEHAGLSERIIQRRIRDALDREKMNAGAVQIAGLDRAPEAINDQF